MSFPRFRLLVVVMFGLLSAACFAAERRPNVLFIAVDDLRPELGCYGSPFIKTPNIDRLARGGVVFDRHYVQFAVCIPSRVALLTSLSPERTHQVYGPPVWEKVAGASAWGRTFHQRGYETISLGKIWHVEGGRSADEFDVVKAEAGGRAYGDPENQRKLAAWQSAKKKRGGNKGDSNDLAGESPIAEAFDAPDSDYIDGALADEAIAQLTRLKGGDKPFMLAVGFHKPHIPFVAPKRYWDLYDEKALPLAPHPDFPAGMPPIAHSGNPNFHNYTYGAHAPLPRGAPQAQVMPEESARWIRHGYFACVSFIDAQVGRVLDALERSGQAGNTIVVLWGDHGFHLGDHNLWGKQTNFETAARSPLIVRAPGRMAAGTHSSALVETVDLLPTLLDLCATDPLPLTDGKSFAPNLLAPSQPGKDAVFHVFNRSAVPPSAVGSGAKPQLVIGHAVRTAQHRLVDWRMGWNLSGERVAVELYDYARDPLESRNVANDPAYAEVRRTLEQRLRAGPPGLNP